MKYSLSIRQPDNYLRQADEIKLEYNDNDILFDYLDKYPKQQFCVGLPNDKNFKPNWDLLSTLNEQSNNRLVIALGILSDIEECQKRNIRYFWRYAVNNYYDLKGLKNLGVSYIHIAGPLVHDLETVKLCNVPLRLIPNVAYDPLIPKVSGISGQYVRPEDVSIYEKYITYFDFAYYNLGQERTFFDVYRSKVWNGNLALLIRDLNIPVDNRGIPDDFATQRIQCKQRCDIPGHSCHFCNITFDLVRTIKESNYKKKKPTEQEQILQQQRLERELNFRVQQDNALKEVLNHMIDMKYLDFEESAELDKKNDDIPE